MNLISILLSIFMRFLLIKGRVLPSDHDVTDLDDSYSPAPVPQDDENPEEKVIGLSANEDRYPDESNYDSDKNMSTKKIKKPCVIIVLSNIQNPSMQSLLRKYRYDANGMLIPGSVKYFIKLPQGLSASPVLVPLNDKAFSPLGGFVRYYKEVPPIPQSW